RSPRGRRRSNGSRLASVSSRALRTATPRPVAGEGASPGQIFPRVCADGPQIKEEIPVRMKPRFLVPAAVVLGPLLLSLCLPPAPAYVEAPMTLGAVLAQSTNVVLMQVESVNREKNFIIYRKIRDIKGKHPQDVIKHNIGRGGLRANEWKP